VGRPGLDPGTLGLREGCIWSDSSGDVGIIRESKKTCPVVSDSSGGVGMVCGKKCGISGRSQFLRVRVGGLTIQQMVAVPAVLRSKNTVEDEGQPRTHEEPPEDLS
jgi:hypothetical protein